MFYIDTHCHLDLFKDIHKNPSVEDDLPIKTISVTNAPFLFEPNSKLFSNAKNVRIALGMHPELASQYSNQLDVFENHITLTRYIGEIGLDGSANHKASFLIQKKVFENILSIVSKFDDKILTVHSRGAASETISTLHNILHKSNCKVILHWYSGNLAALKEAIRYGFFFSINHKMVETAKGVELIRNIPTKNLLTETDAPFTLNKAVNSRLQSLTKTVEMLSVQKDQSPQQMNDNLFANFKNLLS